MPGSPRTPLTCAGVGVQLGSLGSATLCPSVPTSPAVTQRWQSFTASPTQPWGLQGSGHTAHRVPWGRRGEDGTLAAPHLPILEPDPGAAPKCPPAAHWPWRCTSTWGEHSAYPQSSHPHHEYSTWTCPEIPNLPPPAQRWEGTSVPSRAAPWPDHEAPGCSLALIGSSLMCQAAAWAVPPGAAQSEWDHSKPRAQLEGKQLGTP